MAAPGVRFTGVHFWVQDLHATAAFYRLVGFDIPALSDDDVFLRVESPGSAGMEFGAMALTKGYHADFVESAGRGGTCLQMHLESRAAVDAMYGKLLAKGYRGHLPPFDAFWGARYAEVLDPDSNAVGFQSPQDGARTPPPLAS